MHRKEPCTANWSPQWDRPRKQSGPWDSGAHCLGPFWALPDMLSLCQTPSHSCARTLTSIPTCACVNLEPPQGLHAALPCGAQNLPITPVFSMRELCLAADRKPCQLATRPFHEPISGDRAMTLSCGFKKQKSHSCL